MANNGYDRDIEAGVEAPILDRDEQFERYLKTITDEIEWFKYVKIRDYATQQVIPFVMWKHLEYVLLLLRFYRALAILKAKQLGLSWLMAGHAVYKSSKGLANVMEFSRTEDDAADLLDKSRFINANLPRWLQLKVVKDGSELMVFGNGSRIKAFASTEDAGIGQTATLVIRDEADFHKFAEANFDAVRPTVAAGAAQIVDMSTSKRSISNTQFKNEYRRAKKGENNYYPVFLPWYCRPDRDKEWYDRELKQYYPTWRFHQNYPTTEDDALGAIEGLGLFDKAALDDLMNFCIKEPAEFEGHAMIWKRPRVHWQYYAGGDASEGRGGDYQVLWIEGTDGVRRELVALIHLNTMTPDIFAFHAHALLCEYGRPMLVMGADAWGLMVLEALDVLNYTDRIYCTDASGKKLGYQENKKNKQMNFATLGLAVRDGLIVPYKEAVEEMFGMQLNEKGEYESTLPHDDLVVAAAKAQVASKLIGEGASASSEDYS